MSLKQRLKRLRAKAEDGGVLIYQRDGSVKVFDAMTVTSQMFLTRMNLWTDDATASEVLEAVRSATPESRREFEERFGPIVMTNYVIASPANGSWVEEKKLTEEGTVESTRYDGDSEEAKLIRDRVRSGTTSELAEDLSRPPVA